MFLSAREERRPLLVDWKRNYNMLFNRYWNRSNRPSWKAAAEVPEIYPIVSAVIGWMTDQRAQYDVSATAELASAHYDFYDTLADHLEILLNNSYFVNFEEAEVRKALWDAHVYGTGIVKTVWNPSLADGLGDAQMQRISPFAFYPDPTASSMEDADWFVEVKQMSLAAVDRKFPGAAEKLADAAPEYADDETQPTQTDRDRRRGGNRFNPTRTGLGSGFPDKMSTPGSRSYGPEGAVRSRTDYDPYHQGVTVFEAWIRDHETIENELPDGRKQKSVREFWRVVVMCNDVILMDVPADKLWSHRGHPYDRVVLADMGEFWGVSLVSLLISPQELLNKLLVAVVQNIDFVGSPVLVEPKEAGTARTKTHGTPGERILTNAAGAQLIKWLQPPTLHQSIPEMFRYLQNRMEAISGLTAIARGGTPQGRNAQSVIDSVQEAAFVRVRMALRELEKALASAGRKKASLIIDNYTMPRTVSIIGPDGERSHLGLRSRHFQSATPAGAAPLSYSIKVDAGSQRDTSRAAQQAKAERLYAMGAIDEKPLLQAMDWPKAAETAERVQQLRAAGAAAEATQKDKSRR